MLPKSKSSRIITNQVKVIIDDMELLISKRKNIEKDLLIIKEILSQLANKHNFQDGYKFSESSEKAAGWWFYEIDFKPEFVNKIIEAESLTNKNFKNERDILDMIQKSLNEKGAKAKIRLYADKPLMSDWITWFMK